MKYSVVIAEDEVLLLENLIQKVNDSQTGFEVIGSAQTGIQVYDLITELNPDVLITDIRTSQSSCGERKGSGSLRDSSCSDPCIYRGKQRAA